MIVSMSTKSYMILTVKAEANNSACILIKMVFAYDLSNHTCVHYIAVRYMLKNHLEYKRWSEVWWLLALCSNGILNVYVFDCQNSTMNKKKRVSVKMYKYISDQIDEHEKTFDNDNIRDFVDYYWRAMKFGDANERKYLNSE